MRRLQAPDVTRSGRSRFGPETDGTRQLASLELIGSGVDELIFGNALPEVLSGSPPRHLRFQTTALAGLQIECVLLGIGDDSFAGHLPLEAPYRALDILIVMDLYSCHLRPPLNYRLLSSRRTLLFDLETCHIPGEGRGRLFDRPHRALNRLISKANRLYNLGFNCQRGRKRACRSQAGSGGRLAQLRYRKPLKKKEEFCNRRKA